MSLPVDMLVLEHKLILQAVDAIKKRVAEIELAQTINPDLITAIVDFFRTYADKFHHGKEEGILFNKLFRKKIGEADNSVMNELIKEHIFARKTVRALETAKESYLSGNKEAIKQIYEALQTLSTFYPKHIEKEDTRFFYPSMAYFSQEEQTAMAEQFKTFNLEFTDKRYLQIVINSL